MGTKFSCTFEDSRGRTTQRVYGMETQVLLADYVTAVTAFLAAYEPVTDLGFLRGDLIIPVPGLTWAYVADSNKDVGMTAAGLIQGGEGSRLSTKIPGIKMSLVAADGSVAITGAVATLLAMFEDAADFTLARGQQVSEWKKASLDS